MAHRARVRILELLNGFCMRLWCSTFAHLELCSLLLHADARDRNTRILACTPSWETLEMTVRGIILWRLPIWFGRAMLSGMSLSEQNSPGGMRTSVRPEQDLPLKLCECCLWGWLCWVGFCGSLSHAVSQKRPLTGRLTDYQQFHHRNSSFAGMGKTKASLLAVVWF